MAKLVILYNPPKDPAFFDTYYVDTHVPLVKKIPGLRSLELSRGPVVVPGGAIAYHLVVTLLFDSMEALQSGLGSPEGQAATADVANFGEAGSTALIFNHEAF